MTRLHLPHTHIRTVPNRPPPAQPTQNWPRVRALFRRLLSKTKHVKVWLSFAEAEREAAEAATATDAADVAADHTPAGVAASAAVLSEAAALFRSTGQKEERVLVLEAWRDALAAGGASEDELDKVEAMMPKRLKKRRQVYGEDGEAAGCAPSQHPIAPHTPRAAPGALATVHSPLPRLSQPITPRAPCTRALAATPVSPAPR